MFPDESIKETSLQGLLNQQLEAAHSLLFLNEAIQRRLAQDGQLRGSPDSSRSKSDQALPGSATGSKNGSPTQAYRGDKRKAHYGRQLFREALSEGADDKTAGSGTSSSDTPLENASSTQLPSSERFNGSTEPEQFLTELEKPERPMEMDMAPRTPPRVSDSLDQDNSADNVASDLLKEAATHDGTKSLDTTRISMESIRRGPSSDFPVPYEEDKAPTSKPDTTLDLGSLERPAVFEMPDATDMDLSQPLLSDEKQSPADDSCGGTSSAKGGVLGLPKRRNRNVFSCKAPSKTRINAEKEKPEPKKHEFNIEDLYSTEGLAQEIARNMNFQNATLVVILFNTGWMAIDTDYNNADVLSEASPLFQIVDNFFCTYFTFEISVRFLAFAHKCSCLKDWWFIFDSFLVALMVWETWIQVLIYKISPGDADAGTGMRSASVIRIFRAFRLLRISRMTRLLRSMPELFILVKSIGAAMRCMMVTLVMLLIVIYIFAIMFTQLLRGTDLGAKNFPTVPRSINFMLTQVLCGFDEDIISTILDEGLGYYFLWLLYVLVGSLSIMNVLIGILCEVVSGTADTERERAVRKDIENSLESIGMTEEICSVISRSSMMRSLQNKEVASKLEEIGVDVDALCDFVHVFETETIMTIEDFVEMVVQFRGAKAATVRDIVDFRKFVSMEVSFLEAHIGCLQKFIEEDVQVHSNAR